MKFKTFFLSINLSLVVVGCKYDHTMKNEKSISTSDIQSQTDDSMPETIPFSWHLSSNYFPGGAIVKPNYSCRIEFIDLIDGTLTLKISDIGSPSGGKTSFERTFVQKGLFNVNYFAETSSTMYINTKNGEAYVSGYFERVHE